MKNNSLEYRKRKQAERKENQTKVHTDYKKERRGKTEYEPESIDTDPDDCKEREP